MKEYIICYDFSEGEKQGIGKVQLKLPKKIKSIKDLKATENLIKKENNFSSCFIYKHKRVGGIFK